MASLLGNLIRLAYVNPKVRLAVTPLLKDVKIEQDPIKDPETAIPAILEWAGFSGQSGTRLGEGGYGTAYRFGNKVLKFTGNEDEAAAASHLIGREHPNVYTVHKVAYSASCGCYAIVYDYLELPTYRMREATQIADRFYGMSRNWDLDEFLEEIDEGAPERDFSGTPNRISKFVGELALATGLSGLTSNPRKLFENRDFQQILSYVDNVFSGLQFLRYMGIKSPRGECHAERRSGGAD